MQHPIILASTSSTRIRILASANVAFEAQAALCDEQQLKSETKHLTTKELSHFLAEQKALSLAKSNHNSIIIGSDQVLEINNLRLDKVLTIEEARHQLVKLRGQTHHLYSSISCVLAGETIFALD